MTYNSRLQPLQLYFTTGAISSGTLTQLQQSACPTTTAAIMSRSYNFGLGTNDNGNALSISNCRDTNRSQNFEYDNLNRIWHAYTSGPNWGEAFTIDAWGNLTNKAQYLGKTLYEPLNVAPATTKNQLTGFGYDAAGNMTSNGGASYTYDAENRLITAGGVTYIYDGDGNRVKKSSGTLYWGTGPLGESDLSASATSWKDYIFLNGKRIARRDASNSSVHYFISDHLGSTSVTTNSTGGTLEQDIDYYPYGGIASGSSSDHYLFTGKERDSESGLDYFGARHYGFNIGRYVSPDWSARPSPVPFATFGIPQSLNLYSYHGNNPLAGADVDGHCWPLCEVVGAVSSFVARHPAIGEAAGKVVDSLSVKGSVGVGIQTPKTLPVSGLGTATGYVASAENGVSAGVNLNAQGKIGGFGGQVNVDIPGVKDGHVVNPIKNASVDVSPVVGGDKGSMEVEASVNKDEATVGGMYGEGVVGGFEIGTTTNALGELGGAIIGGLVSDISDTVHDAVNGNGMPFHAATTENNSH